MEDALSPPDQVAESYDAVAVRYTALARDELAALPLDRAVLAAFAETVLAAGGGPVLEAGCGSGRIAAHLRDLGLDMSGVDLSPVMVDLARADHPDLRFTVGSLDALDLADGALDGLVSWYSVIHLPPAALPGCLREFRRVLAPGGHLLLAFFAAEGDAVTVFDHRVAPACRWPVEGLAGLAREAGFVEVGRMSREPREDERHRRGHLLLRRPAD